MSYSRWSNSRWYTFWCVHPRDQRETRASAIFSVMDSHAANAEPGERQFNAAEIRKNVDACVGKFTGTADELQELRGYMLEFVDDVDRRYPRGGDKQ